MISSLGRYETVLGPLIDELLKNVFIGYNPINVESESAEAFHGDDSYCSSSSTHKEFLELETYADKYAYALDILNELNAEKKLLHQGYSMRDITKNNRALQKAFNHTIYFIRDACFLLWKKQLLKYKKHRFFVSSALLVSFPCAALPTLESF